MVVVCRQRNYPPSICVLSEGGVEMVVVVCQQRKHPPLSHVSSEGGGWRGYVDQEPLRLAIQAREGLVVMR